MKLIQSGTAILASLILPLFMADAVADTFPFAPGTFDEQGHLKVWTWENVRNHRDKTVGNTHEFKKLWEKDNAADPTLLGDTSSTPDETKNYTKDVDLTEVSGMFQIAIQVDDVAELTITDITESENSGGTPPKYKPFKVDGTALWNKSQSYQEFPQYLPAGRKYNFALSYKNESNLTGKHPEGYIDYDGVSVFIVLDPKAPVDLDVDSDNNNGFLFPSCSKEEDEIEALGSSDQPGKIIAVPLDPDADDDGVADAVDGFDGLGDRLDKTQFVPMVVSLSPMYDPANSKVILNYKMSDPRGLSKSAPSATSGFRIWTSDAGVVRSTATLPESANHESSGYFLPADKEISWQKLINCCKHVDGGKYEGPAVIVYLETVVVSENLATPSANFLENPIPVTITAKPSSGSEIPETTDVVCIDVRCTGGVQISGTRVLMVNDDDDNGDGKPDKDDDRLGFLDDDVKQVTVKITTLDQPIKVTIDSKQLFPDLVVPTPTGPGGLIDGVYPGLRLANGVAVDRDGDGQTESDADGQSKKGWKKGIYTIEVPANTTIVDNLYIEGLRRSTATDDVIMTAAIEAPDVYAGNPEKCIATTKADHKLTVYGLDLDVDANGSVLDDCDGLYTYLPGYEGADPQLHQGGKYKDARYKDAQDMRLYVVGVTDGLEGEARMVESTSYKGYASNGMDDALQEGKPDFSLTQNGSADEVVPGQVDATGLWFPLHCKDYGGWCKVEITLKKDGVVIDQLIKSVPADSNGDKIADCWQRAEIDRWNAQYPGTAVIEKVKSGLDKWPIDSDAELANSDGSGPMPSMAGDGDGLTVSKEYRGYLLDDGVAMNGRSHKRLSLARKELLAEVREEANLTQGQGPEVNIQVLANFDVTANLENVRDHYRDNQKGAAIDLYWVELEFVVPVIAFPEIQANGNQPLVAARANAYRWDGDVTMNKISDAYDAAGLVYKDNQLFNGDPDKHAEIYGSGLLTDPRLYSLNRDGLLGDFVKLYMPSRLGLVNRSATSYPDGILFTHEHSRASDSGVSIQIVSVADERKHELGQKGHFTQQQFIDLIDYVVAHETGHLLVPPNPKTGWEGNHENGVSNVLMGGDVAAVDQKNYLPVDLDTLPWGVGASAQNINFQNRKSIDP